MLCHQHQDLCYRCNIYICICDFTMDLGQWSTKARGGVLHKWHSCFERGRPWLEDDLRSGRPFVCTTLENVHKILHVVYKDSQVSNSKGSVANFPSLTQNWCLLSDQSEVHSKSANVHMLHKNACYAGHKTTARSWPWRALFTCNWNVLWNVWLHLKYIQVFRRTAAWMGSARKGRKREMKGRSKSHYAK